jgi:hypothetical protein
VVSSLWARQGLEAVKPRLPVSGWLPTSILPRFPRVTCSPSVLEEKFSHLPERLLCRLCWLYLAWQYLPNDIIMNHEPPAPPVSPKDRMEGIRPVTRKETILNLVEMLLNSTEHPPGSTYTLGACIKSSAYRKLLFKD